MSLQLLFSEPVLTALALFGPFPPHLLNWVARHAPIQPHLRPPALPAAPTEFAACPVRLPRAGSLDLPALWAQLPEVEDGATDFPFAFPVGTCLYQLEAAARICQLGTATGGRVVRLVPQPAALEGWLRLGPDYAHLRLHLHPDGRPFWAEVVAAGTPAAAARAGALLARV
ncbi:MAG: hypothetical protein JWP58_62 [Hymenobacter sp.]|nr:hypothetical protein [Hymenobacter sp.]